jgi:tetratricopeptide (TPR) repeat protein
MSPEQATADKIDGRTDTYALACLIYEMLTGSPPYMGRNVASIVQQHLAAPIPSVTTIRPTVSEKVSGAIQRAMAKTPADRFTTTAAFGDALKGSSSLGVDDFLQDLIRRRVPHVLGVYALLAIGVVVGVNFLIDQFVLSPHLTSFTTVMLASLIPAVSVVAFFRGRAWTWKAKVTIPANVVGSMLLLALMFNSTDLGAATTSIVVTDEDGNAIERVVPKSEFRKRVAIFAFDNESGNEDLAWLQHGVPVGLDMDLEQDMFVQSTTTEEMIAGLREAGFPDGTNVPLTLKRQLATDEHSPYFVSGTFTTEGNDFALTVRLYETRRGKLLTEQVYTGPELFPLLDDAARQLRVDLGIPTSHIEDSEDLPVAAMMTQSEESYRHLVEAYQAITIDEDWATAATAIASAVEGDPTYAHAHLLQYIVNVLGNDRATATRALQNAMQHSYKLPERIQYIVKMAHYEFNQQPDKQMAVARMRVDMFSDDIDGRMILAQLFIIRDQTDSAIAQYEAILEIDPTQYDLVQQLGRLYQGEGNFDRASGYFGRYAELFPDDYESYMALGRLNRIQGEFEEAAAQFERALLIEPNRPSILLSLASLERRLGNLDAELEQIEAVMPRARTAQDSVQVLAALRSAYAYRGQTERAIEYMHQGLAVSATFTPPVGVLMERLSALNMYIRAGQEARARETLAAVSAQLQPPFDGLLPVGTLVLALETKDPSEADAAVQQIEAFIRAFGAGGLQDLVLTARGRILELREQWEDAIAAYEAQLAADPTELSIHTAIGRCHRMLGALGAAEEALEKSLAGYPFSPTVHYELALVMADRGDTQQAIEHLETALRVWTDADDSYEPARNAREKLAELQ